MEHLWNVSSEGYTFSGTELNKSVKGTVVLKCLELLASSNAASEINGNYLVSHVIAATLSNENKEVLGLPLPFPYQISVTDAQGDLGHNDFRYRVVLLKPDGTAFINPMIIGSYVKIDSTREYILDQYQYEMLCLSADCNSKIKNINNSLEANHFNLLNVAKMQQLGRKADAEISKYINETKVVVADKISVDFEKNKINGRYYAKPILLKKNEDNDFELIQAESFSNSFESGSDVQDVYIGADGIKYVCTEDVKRGLDKVKRIKPLKKIEYDRFCIQPREIFDDEIFVFPEGVYSDRVIDFTTVKYKGYTVDWLNEGGWIPEEGQSSSFGLEVTPENVDLVEDAVKKADEKGLEYIEINGEQIPITQDLKTKIKKVREIMELPGEELGPDGKEPIESKRYVLDVKKNDERLDYVTTNKIRPDLANLASGLKPEIKLYEHQLMGVSWLYKQWCEGYRGVLLADDMGLGKTLQTLAFVSGILKNFSDYVKNPILIVAPVSLLRNWKNEISQFVDSEIYQDIVELHSGNLRNYKKNGKLDLSTFAEKHSRCIVQTTYETLRDNQLDFGMVPWSVIITDEAQKIKNPSASQTIAMKAMKYDFAIALSGTPVENSWIDLWSIMDFVQPGKLGNFKLFKEEYHNKLKANKNNTKFLEELGMRLQRQIDPLFLRRLKKDHLNGLPLKNVEYCKEEMPLVQREAYLSAIDLYKKYGGQTFEIIARLRDISLHPGLADIKLDKLASMNVNEIINASARLKSTFQILMNIYTRQEKALIFVISKKMQLIMQLLIHKIFGIEVPTPINGDMIGVKRQSVIDAFEAKEGFGVLILSPEAAGVGLNITGANNVIHLSRTWNPAKEDQATDRVYRIGQKRDVNVYIPMSICRICGVNGSFDEKLNTLLEYKRTLSENVLFPTNESREDFIDIINGITGNNTSEDNYAYYSIDDIQGVTGLFFEKILRKLYENLGYDAIKTPDSKDRGADVLAWPDSSHKKGFLIQSKQTSTDDNMDAAGVQEVVTSLGYYKKLYPDCNWSFIVITNAPDFTAGAKEMARDNNVKLIARKELAEMLVKGKVKKF